MKKQQGFTLVELVIVVILIGILAAMAVPRFFNLTANSYAKTAQGTAKAFKAAVNAARGQWMAAGEPAAGIDFTQSGTITVGFHATNKWPNRAGATNTTAVGANTVLDATDLIGSTSTSTTSAPCSDLMKRLLNDINVNNDSTVVSGGTALFTDATCVGYDWCAVAIAVPTTGLTSTATHLASAASATGCLYNFTKDKGTTARYFTYNATTGEVVCTGCGTA